MKKLIELFIYKSFEEILNSKRIAELESELEISKNRLKKSLNKNQKKLLLRIIDAKDLKAEECGCKGFVSGFKWGLKIGYEANKDAP